jgi:UMF1 family MFS transporter
LIPYLGLRDRPPVNVAPVQGSLVREAFGQLANTFRHLRGFPHTLRFLLAYLFFNDGIQTVIGVSSVYGAEQLGFSTNQLIETILLVQIVAFGGALLFGRLALRYGARDVVLSSLVLWAAVVAIGFFLPHGEFGLWLGLAVLIGVVLGGSQALSRSLYSQLVPRGREAEYFSLYQACERGTSWFGTLLFGLVHQLTDSYRPAILALLVFFVLGGLILRTVDVRQGIRDAGNVEPAVV